MKMNKAYPVSIADPLSATSIGPGPEDPTLEQPRQGFDWAEYFSWHRGYEKPAQLVNEGLTDEDHANFSRYFRVFDEDEKGYCIIAHALEIIMAVKGDSIKESIEATLQQLDDNQDGLIQYEEFATAMLHKEQFGIVLSEVAERLLEIKKTNDYIVTTKSSLQMVLAKTNIFIPKIYVLDITDSILRSKRIYYLTRWQRLFLTFESTNSRVSCLVALVIVIAVVLSVVAGMLATLSL